MQTTTCVQFYFNQFSREVNNISNGLYTKFFFDLKNDPRVPPITTYNLQVPQDKMIQTKHGWIQRGTGGFDPLKNYKNLEFLSKIGQDPLKITKLPSQHSIIAHNWTASENQLNDILLKGQ